MRPLSVASVLPTYADASALRLPSYAEQWDEAILAHPAAAHVAAGDAFEAGPSLESNVPAAQPPMRAVLSSQAPSRQRPAPTTNRVADACILGCARSCSASAIVGTMVATGAIMVLVGYLKDETAVRALGGVIVGCAVVGAIVHTHYDSPR